MPRRLVATKPGCEQALHTWTTDLVRKLKDDSRPPGIAIEGTHVSVIWSADPSVITPGWVVGYMPLIEKNHV